MSRIQRLQRTAVPWMVGLLSLGSTVYVVFFVTWLAENILGPEVAEITGHETLWDIMTTDVDLVIVSGVSPWGVLLWLGILLIISWFPVLARFRWPTIQWAHMVFDLVTVAGLVTPVFFGITLSRFYTVPQAAAVVLLVLDAVVLLQGRTARDNAAS